jgi:hypothetical protein
VTPEERADFMAASAKRIFWNLWWAGGLSILGGGLLAWHGHFVLALVTLGVGVGALFAAWDFSVKYHELRREVREARHRIPAVSTEKMMPLFGGRPYMYVLDGKTPRALTGELDACIMEWGLSQESDSRIVAQDEIRGARVSTVFLGWDTAFTGPPVTFETMVFGGKMDGHQRRYRTWSDAEQGHAEVVSQVNTAEGGNGLQAGHTT